MRCLCCGKEISEKNQIEIKNEWHQKCVKRFWGTDVMPVLELDARQLEKLVDETVNKGLTVPGVQKKLSLHLSKGNENRLTIVNYPTGYILKPQSDEYASLPEFEALAMDMADATGIQTVPHSLMKFQDGYAYVTKRIDRNNEDTKSDFYAMEDFCQLSNRLTRDKYKGSYEVCGKIVKKYSTRGGFDLTELFMRIVFSYAIGNSDMHLKNFSLIETMPGNRKFVLSKAYDLLPVNVILPADTEQMALTLNGKKKNIRLKDFFALAESLNISKSAARKMIQSVVSLEEVYLECCREARLNEQQQQEMITLVKERIEVLRAVGAK